MLLSAQQVYDEMVQFCADHPDDTNPETCTYTDPVTGQHCVVGAYAKHKGWRLPEVDTSPGCLNKRRVHRVAPALSWPVDTKAASVLAQFQQEADRPTRDDITWRTLPAAIRPPAPTAPDA